MVNIKDLSVKLVPGRRKDEPDHLNAILEFDREGGKFGCTIVLPPGWRTRFELFQACLQALTAGLMSLAVKEDGPAVPPQEEDEEKETKE